MRRDSWFVGSVALLAAASCSGGRPGSGFQDVGTGGGNPTSGNGSDGGGQLGGNGSTPNFADAQTNGVGTPCNVTDPNADMDHDGWSPNQGDCNDCDPNVNPGAIDVLHTNDGGPPTWGDED